MQRTLSNKIITTDFHMMPLNDLKFYYQNPRVYSVLHLEHGREPTQEEIFEVMRNEDHVKELKTDIRKSGGLTEAVIVREDTNEVIEGNSRLAAYKLLYDEEPLKWHKISCEILPKDITQYQIFELIGKVHMSGKKKWEPYEEAAWLWRLTEEDKKSMSELKKLFGWSADKIKNYISTYQYMIEKNITDKADFSNYLVMNTNKHIKKFKDDFPQLDEIITKKINNGEINKAIKIRDELPIIANAPKKVQKKFIQGDLNFEEAVNISKGLGGDEAAYKRLKEFNDWLVMGATNITKLKGGQLDSVKHTMGLIKINIEKYLERLNKN